MNIDDLGFYVEKNLDRVKGMLDIYDNLSNVNRGRKSVNSLDVLRSTVVLLHASLEDFLRGLLKIKLPKSHNQHLVKIPLYVDESTFSKKNKFDLGELSKHKSLTVEKVIQLSVNQYLDRESFNNTKEISAALISIEIDITPRIEALLPTINKMIQRRHSIVHQADREKREGYGFHNAKSISKRKVNKWFSNVDEFIVEIVKQL